MGSQSNGSHNSALEETLAEAASEVEVSLLLEILYYAQETDLVELMRTAAPLDPSSRRRVTSFARSLAQQASNVEWMEVQEN